LFCFTVTLVKRCERRRVRLSAWNRSRLDARAPLDAREI
jgi:hypothetical protein